MFDGEYIPTDFDILLTDVHARDLHENISSQLGSNYLADYTENTENKQTDYIEGIIWGPHQRIFVPMIIKIKNKKKYVHMLIDTGSPATYLCEEVFGSFDIMIYNPSNPMTVNINDKPIAVLQSPVRSHFSEINILGSDYLKISNAIVNINYGENVVKVSLFNV